MVLLAIWFLPSATKYGYPNRLPIVFITNAIIGIQPISKYRKKEYSVEVAKSLLGRVNALARLS